MISEYEQACIEYDKGNYAVAYEGFYALAAGNEVSGQMNVANMLLHGIGTAVNVKKAYEWYKKAADNNDCEAQYIYGWNCIEKGNEKEGIAYLAQAGDGGYADAVYDLAGFFVQGMYSCEVDMSKAMTLYEQAVLMGKDKALSGLFYTKNIQEGRVKAIWYFLKNIFKLAKSLKQSS